MLKPHLALCLEASVTLGSFGKFKVERRGTKNTIDLEERENVSRIDLGIGLRFYK
jgi:nucleoid DNA-binding protein